MYTWSDWKVEAVAVNWSKKRVQEKIRQERHHILYSWYYTPTSGDEEKPSSLSTPLYTHSPTSGINGTANFGSCFGIDQLDSIGEKVIFQSAFGETLFDEIWITPKVIKCCTVDNWLSYFLLRLMTESWPSFSWKWMQTVMELLTGWVTGFLPDKK